AFGCLQGRLLLCRGILLSAAERQPISNSRLYRPHRQISEAPDDIESHPETRPAVSGGEESFRRYQRLNRIIASYPGSPEAETALLQKGLTLGQQGDYPQMTATLHDLLTKFPNTPGAAQANYWIGWAAFEAKRYDDAISPLLKARELSPDEFAEKTTLRLILCYQNLHRKEDAAKEVDGFIQKDPLRTSLLLDVCRWLGSEFFNESNSAQAAKYFGLVTKDADPAKIDKNIWFSYAKSLKDLKNYTASIPAVTHYLEQATDPAERAQGFLVLSSGQLG